MAATELIVDGLTKRFASGRRQGARGPALDGVSISIGRATRMGIVGESGSGKSTLARILVGLETPTTGSVTFDGRDVHAMRAAERKDFRRRVQLIGQDTSSSFDPTKTLRDAVRRPAQLLLGVARPAADDLVDATLEAVGLTPAHADRMPHQVSGGQRQRIAIARALVVRPEIVVCDEVVSALDVSVQGTVLNLLKSYCVTAGVGMVFISHGLPATAFVSTEIVVMRDGVIVEQGPRDAVLHHSTHPYTRTLVDAHRGVVHAAAQTDRGLAS
jgi:ABC-type glutathione transport system ATPase component